MTLHQPDAGGRPPGGPGTPEAVLTQEDGTGACPRPRRPAERALQVYERMPAGMRSAADDAGEDPFGQF